MVAKAQVKLVLADVPSKVSAFGLGCGIKYAVHVIIGGAITAVSVFSVQYGNG